MRDHRNRDPTRPGRVLITPESGTAFYGTITRADEPTEAGCPIDKTTLDEFLAASGVTTGSASALVLSQPGFQLADGAVIRFRLHVDSGATPTINVNGTGVKKLMKTAEKPMKSGIKAGTWLTAIYSSVFDFFVLQGSGDEKLHFGNDPGQISSIQWLLDMHISDLSTFIGGN